MDPESEMDPEHKPVAAVEILEQRRGKRRTLAVLLGIMATMAAIALIFALTTTGQRREQDKKRPPRQQVLPQLWQKNDS